MAEVKFRGSRKQIRAIAYYLRDVLVGNRPDDRGIARGFLIAIGFAALSDIKESYIVKARGGTDAMGVKWPKLSPKTLAYSRRFGPGEKTKLKKKAGLGRAHQRRGLLTAQQDKEWKKIFGGVFNRLLLSTSREEAASRAAQIAWARLKEKGAKTMLEVYGNREVEILRDTGVLFNSLSPGLLGGVGPSATYDVPEDQIFEINAGEVVVGTTVEYAASHQEGDGVPRRQFLPDDQSQIPEQWWKNWLDLAVDALEAGATEVAKTGGVP